MPHHGHCNFCLLSVIPGLDVPRMPRAALPNACSVPGDLDQRPYLLQGKPRPGHLLLILHHAGTLGSLQTPFAQCSPPPHLSTDSEGRAMCTGSGPEPLSALSAFQRQPSLLLPFPPYLCSPLSRDACLSPSLCNQFPPG